MVFDSTGLDIGVDSLIVPV